MAIRHEVNEANKQPKYFVVVLAMQQYSDSQPDREITGYFLALKNIGLASRKKKRNHGIF